MGSSRKHSFRARLAAFLVVTLATLAILEVGFRFIYYQRHSDATSAVAYYGRQLLTKLKSRTTTRQVTFKKPLYRADSELGYSCYPGRHELAIELHSLLGTDVWQYTADIDDQGYRTTSHAAELADDKPQIWIHGCSFTWGYGLDNADSFPFLVQAELPAYAVKNYGGNGYATVHALLQLRKLLTLVKPVVVIIVYNDIHLRRNLAAKSFLFNFQTAGILDQLKPFRYPRVTLIEGKPNVELVSILGGIEQGFEPSMEEMVTVAFALMDEIQELCVTYEVPHLLAIQTESSHDSLVDYCDERGWKIVDMALPSPLPEEFTLSPYDTHPNRAAHEQYAAKLLKRLKPFLARHSQR